MGGSEYQGCQMVYFQTKNPNLGESWRALDWKMLVYFTAIWDILRPFGAFFPVLVSCTKKNLATLLNIMPEMIRSERNGGYQTQTCIHKEIGS
jgi:hypothetical protein